MGFGEYDGTLENAQKRIGQSVGLRRLLVGALIGDWLEFLREVVRKRLEHARNDLLHSGIRIGNLHREGTQQASSAPKLWRAFLQMLKKGKSLFNRVHNYGVRSTCQHLVGACTALAVPLYFMGDFETARQNAIRGSQIWRSGGAKFSVEGIDAPAVTCLIYAALSEWQFGEIASSHASHATMAESISLAKDLMICTY